MNSLLKKLIAVLLVIILVSANLIVLGEYTIAYAASDDELNKQNSETNNKNVLFNSYFDAESHSKVFKINDKEAKIYLKLRVDKAGYVENGTVEFQNANFKIKDGVKNDNIQSLDINNNKVVLDRVNNGSEIVLELPIEILNEDNVSVNHFNKEFVTKFTGTYIDENGKEKKVVKEVTNKLSWNGEAEAEISSKAVKYIPYSLNENKGLMLQTKVNVNVKDSALPIKNTNIEIEVPVVNNLKPTSVAVIAKSMAATNGKEEGLDFTNENYSYDEENGKLIINVDNLKDSISWKKNVKDEYLVTYLYDGEDMYNFAKSNSINTTSNILAKITLYNNEEIISEKAISTEIKLEGKEDISDFEIEATNNISKGYIYANYDAKSKKETEYSVNYIATVSSAKIVSSVELKQGIDAFVTEEKAEGNTTVSGTNYAYNKKIEVRQDIFNKMLGEEGSITVKSGNKELGVINKETKLEDGKYVLDISKENTNKITLTTSAPITEGQIEVNIVKALKGNIDYSKDQMKEFKTLKVEVAGSTNIASGNAEKSIELKEPETKIDLEINKKDLTTVVKNENVEIRAVLDTSNVYNALYKNPTLKITLPSEIEKVDVKGTNILLDNGLKIKSTKVSEENGHKVINIILEGTQSKYAINAEYKGAIIVINTDLTLDTLAASGKEKITMEYNNENDAAIKTKGTVEEEINIVAPTGVVASAGINGYKDGAKEVESISGEAQTVEIEANSEERTATLEGAVVNNYPNDISNVVVLGRIPAQGNKAIDSDNELGSTFTIPLAKGVGTVGLSASDYKVYYSDNANATKDLNDKNNGWKEEATTASKSYMMVFDDEYKMKQGDKFEFSYDVAIPESLTMNNSAYSMYKVYFDNEAEIGTMSEEKTAAILGVTTGEGAVLEAELSSTVEDTVREGQYVKMKVNVNNVGEKDATGVKVNVPKPESAVFYDYVTGNGFFENNVESLELEVGDLKAGETKQVSYYIKYDNYIESEAISDDEAHEEGNISIFPKEITHKVNVTANEMSGEVESNEYKVNVEDGSISLNLVSDTMETQVLHKGQYVEYLINLYNIDTLGDLTNTTVTVKLPEGITFSKATIKENWDATEETTDGVSYNEETNTVTVNIGTLKQQKLIDLIVQVEDYEGDVSIIASATADGKEVHYTNITEYEAEKINLEISELTSSPRYVKEGEIITYKLKVTNNGNGTVRDLTIIDQIPDELDFVKATYTYLNGKEEAITQLTEDQLHISVNQFLPGETTEITIMAKATLIPTEDDVEVKNTLSVLAKNFDTVQTNTVTNYIEYNDEIHRDEGGSTTTNNRHKITGTAWLDDNLNGKRDPEEQPISNIQVMLLNKEGNIIVKDLNTNEDKITTTSSSGTYEFDNLPDGEYLVVFAYDSSNYTLTEYQKDGVDESFNSDAIDINLTLNGERRIAGITDTLVVSGENVRDIDIGLYTANKFDLRLDKYIDKISLTTPTIGTRVDEYNNSQLGKVEVLGQNLGKSSAVVEYKIVVTNEGSVPGYVNKIVDYLPENVDFNTELNTDWYLSDNGNIYNSSLTDQKINPGESKEVTLVVSVKITEDLLGTITNNAEIYESYNELGLQDIDSTVANKIETEDDMGKADVIFSLVTGKVVMYTSIAFVVIALIGFGAYEIKKHVLNKKV